jgi:DNA-binding transcriptional MerR regulator
MSVMTNETVHLTIEELAVAVGVEPVLLVRLVQAGLLGERADQRQFPPESARRVRRILRLRADLGVSLTGSAIIADLLERIDRLEAELARLRSQ